MPSKYGFITPEETKQSRERQLRRCIQEATAIDTLVTDILHDFRDAHDLGGYVHGFINKSAAYSHDLYHRTICIAGWWINDRAKVHLNEIKRYFEGFGVSYCTELGCVMVVMTLKEGVVELHAGSGSLPHGKYELPLLRLGSVLTDKVGWDSKII
jgi:hypothetical protein